MYVAPNSIIKLMTVPLEPTYDHTLYFSTATQQANYFNNLNGLSFHEQYYTRPYRGAIRVETNAENSYSYNYMMFRNTAYGNKWFYAFITECRWINNQVTEFRFEIDVMQTWMFDYELDNCFVEREHSFTDNIGDNLVPENLELGDRKFIDNAIVPVFNNYKIVVISTVDINLQDYTTSTLLAGVYNGLNYIVFNNKADADAFVTAVNSAGKPDAIIAIYMIPYAFTEVDNNGEPVKVTHNIPKDYYWQYTYDNKTGPRNNKLYTAPYNLLVCVDQNGNANEMPFEYFNDPGDANRCPFELMGISAPAPEAQIIPKYFKGLPTNYNERMVISNFPMCSYATDAFKAWLAQNKASLIVRGEQIAWSYMQANTPNTGNLSNMAMGGLRIAGGDIGGAMQLANGAMGDMTQRINASANAGLQVAGVLAEMARHAVIPPIAHGQSSNALGIASKTLGFRFYTLRLRDQFAAIIDDYFDRYGYACHRNVRPNTHSRPHWNYVKTIGCTLHGSIPGDVAKQISSIYDNGITFWKNASEVGNYDLDNRPT